MMATYWLTRSMRDSEPVVGVTPTTLPARTAALCAVAVVPFLCGVLALFAFLHFHPVGARVYGAFSPPAQVAVLVGQIVVPSLGGPLLGVALGRWVRFPGAAFVLFLVIFGWVNVATIPSLSHPDSAAFTALRLFSPFAFFTYTEERSPTSRPGAGRRGSSSAGSSRCARSRYWWRCCAGPTVGCASGSSVPFRSSWWWPRSCSCWPPPAGSPTRSTHDGPIDAAGRGMAGGHRGQRRGGRGGRLRRRVPRGRHRAVPDRFHAARRRGGVHPRRAGQPGRRRDTDRARPAHRDPVPGAAGPARRRRGADAGRCAARAGAAVGGDRARARRQRGAGIRRGVCGPHAHR